MEELRARIESLQGRLDGASDESSLDSLKLEALKEHLASEVDELRKENTRLDVEIVSLRAKCKTVEERQLNNIYD